MFKPKVLVAYASKSGTTIDVAHAVAEALREQGLVVDVRHVSKLNHLEGYQAVVVGSGVRAGHWLPAAVHFVEEHQEALRQMPVAFFTVCMTMTEDTPENREIVEGYTAALQELVNPVSIGLFAGRLEMDRLSTVERLIVRIMHAPLGDFRDWATIHDWAAGLAQIFGEVRPVVPERL